MSWSNRLVRALGIWRVSYMLVIEDGPADVFDTLRRYANRGPLSSLFACVYCMSVWVSAAAAFNPFAGLRSFVLETLAGSALAMLIHESFKAIMSVSSSKRD